MLLEEGLPRFARNDTWCYRAYQPPPASGALPGLTSLPSGFTSRNSTRRLTRMSYSVTSSFQGLPLINISEPTRTYLSSYAVLFYQKKRTHQ